MNKNITIAGLGWLGKPFAASLIKKGYRVKGSVTDQTKVASLKTLGFDTHKVVLTEGGTVGQTDTFLAGTDVLVIMIPPGLRGNTGTNYALKMAHFLHTIEASQVAKVILVSSTSVYDDSQGKVTEKDRPKPELNAAKQLYEVEQLIFNATSFRASIVRFGGLYGDNRNPVRFLAGRQGLNNGAAPVNLIHRDDCIGILTAIIKQDAFGHIFNAVTPQHPSKRDYYTRQALDKNLEPPSYNEDTQDEVFKQVDSVNLREVLDYNFVHELM